MTAHLREGLINNFWKTFPSGTLWSRWSYFGSRCFKDEGSALSLTYFYIWVLLHGMKCPPIATSLCGAAESGSWFWKVLSSHILQTERDRHGINFFSIIFSVMLKMVLWQLLGEDWDSEQRLFFLMSWGDKLGVPWKGDIREGSNVVIGLECGHLDGSHRINTVSSHSALCFASCCGLFANSSQVG